ncbi:bifunctional 2-polyprenyl-6-hydroxyphenol methylase/3-demethylubiquinol 3-O-methyltransferase UbiG [Verticiella sediminum]|uniref:Ubiquinone biosynthesis O-methyltransferase n=1 Tax=Verticiella sediminum TaxID=1247510 RepID=A0A556AKJ1_9BURK|nr:bifunctional 2-polyprenyl-6-hydroxyphenol methylase/3-demethylubiquinol 3-O-methyltransferase UbiG [Verticiella sediminum]TSH93409.1 bifunctional 2-polyprenyl-6-hydroxyphenol methylase/3-demethylubiquinol 3-O-methyltransferase UbiG [Verticiella sediminum]
MTATPSTTNASAAELAKFSALASRWWDPTSEFKPLHAINPLRLGWIEDIVAQADSSSGRALVPVSATAAPAPTAPSALQGKRIVDVGCGGGILAESMAKRGATVTGIDLAEKPLTVARLHSLESGVKVDYRCIAVEDLARDHPGTYDIVTCMEMLEHVPDPASVVRACATLVKPGGHVFLSTINRNLKSFLQAIVAAEFVLRMLPRGTHDYANFLKPSELAMACRGAGLEITRLQGFTYNPLTDVYSLTADTGVNYLMATRRPLPVAATA